MTRDAQWDWYLKALSGSISPIRESNPETGFYRHHIGTPVAIWRDGGEVIMLLDGEVVEDAETRGRVWLSVAKSPVSKEAYDERVTSGAWPDTAPVVSASTPGPGDNSGDTESYERMRADILGDVSEAEAYYARTKVETRDEANRAHDWGDRLIRSARRADALRKKENEPLRRQIAENDAKWNSIIQAGERKGDALRGIAEAWGRAEASRLKREAEEQARERWQQEQEALQKAAAEASRLAAAATQHDDDGLVIEEIAAAPPLPIEAEPPPPVVPDVKVMLGSGNSGNRRSVKTSLPETATITDLREAALHFATIQHPALVDLIQKLADRAIKSRAIIPGVRFSWQSVAGSAPSGAGGEAA